MYTIDFGGSIGFPVIGEILLESFFGLGECVFLDNQCTFSIKGSDCKVMVSICQGHKEGLCFGDQIIHSGVCGSGTGFDDIHQNLHQIDEVVINNTFHCNTVFCFLCLLVCGTS